MKKTMQSENKDIIWDVVVLGGGPAGMMTAGRAGERGLKVLLLEKNKSLGKKLLRTGNGRCNITNNKLDVRTMLLNYKDGGKFLFSTFAQHSVQDTISFFKNLGVILKEENEGRLFPVTDSAQTVREALYAYTQKNNVTIRKEAHVTAIEKDAENTLFCISYNNTQQVFARSCVVATGGTSHPETGSTGEGFEWLKALGHTVSKNNPSLVPIAVKEQWVKNLAGLALSECTITIFSEGKKHSMQKGKILFTHFGLSGPLVLNISKTVGELLTQGEVILKIDLVPLQNEETLRKSVHQLLVTESNRKLKNVLGDFIPSTLITPFLKQAGIDGETPNHSVSSQNRRKLVTFLKALPCTVDSLLSVDKAIISSGGVSPTEVDFKTMESRIVPKLFLVGDVLDIDRPSGGYSLQLCWSTGFVAGTHIQ